MWISARVPQPTWIQFDFDGVYKLTEMRVWNYNVIFESVLGFGFKDVTIEYSTDGTTWTVLKEAQFAQAAGQDESTPSHHRGPRRGGRQLRPADGQEQLGRLAAVRPQ